MGRTTILLLVLSSMVALGSARAIATTGHGPELRAAARQTSRFDSRRRSPRPMDRATLDALPPAAGRVVGEACFDNREGGDVLGVLDCYQNARETLVLLAQRDEQTRLLGVLGLALSLAFAGALLGLSHLARRNERWIDAADADPR